MELIATIGLPASGKSTFAKKLCKDRGFKRVNKDDLRAMIDAGAYSPENESNIEAARDVLVSTFLHAGLSVVCDDTNFHPDHIDRLKLLAQVHGAKFCIEDFCHVPLEECLRRDAERDVGHVGEDVIRGMYERYMA